MIALSAPPVLAKVNTLQADVTALDAVADSIEEKVDTVDGVADAINATVNGGSGALVTPTNNVDFNITQRVDNASNVWTPKMQGWTYSDADRNDAAIAQTAPALYVTVKGGYAYLPLSTYGMFSSGNCTYNSALAAQFNTLSVEFMLSNYNEAWGISDNHYTQIGFVEDPAVFGSNRAHGTYTPHFIGLLHSGQDFRLAAFGNWAEMNTPATIARNSTNKWKIKVTCERGANGGAGNWTIKFYRNDVLVYTNGPHASNINSMKYKYFGFGVGSSSDSVDSLFLSNILIKWSNE